MRKSSYRINNQKITITRTFRIKDQWDKILHEEANRQDISVNVLVNKVLRQYVLFGRFVDRIKILSLSNRTFKQIIQFMPDEKIAIEGERCGSLDAIEIFNTLDLSQDYDSFTFLIKEQFGSSQFAGWYRCFHHPKENQDLFHLQHDLGRKWSIFLESYLRSILKNVNKTQVESRIYDYAVTLKVSRPPK